jgi:hypothetical protein
MPRTLNVYWESHLVGELTQDGARLSFRYDESYRSQSAVLPLSRHLPLRDAVFAPCVRPLCSPPPVFAQVSQSIDIFYHGCMNY